VICERCGRVAPTAAVTFRSLLGLLVVRRTRELSAELCRDCLGEVFRGYTLVTAVGGWWGIISFFLTPVVLGQNVRQYLASRGLARPAAGAEQALAVAERTRPLVDNRAQWVNARLAQGCGLRQVAEELAREEGADPVAVEVTLRLLTWRGGNR